MKGLRSGCELRERVCAGVSLLNEMAGTDGVDSGLLPCNAIYVVKGLVFRTLD